MAFHLSEAQFQHLAQTSFEQRMLAILREHFPEQTDGETDARLAEEIWRQVARAQRYGLDDEQSAGMFVLTAFVMGVGFDERIPAMVQILNAKDLSAASKAQAMQDFMTVVFSELERARAGSASAPQAGGR